MGTVQPRPSPGGCHTLGVLWAGQQPLGCNLGQTDSLILETSPDCVAQLVRASSQYVKVVGLIPSQGIYKGQPVNP